MHFPNLIQAGVAMPLQGGIFLCNVQIVDTNYMRQRRQKLVNRTMW